MVHGSRFTIVYRLLFTIYYLLLIGWEKLRLIFNKAVDFPKLIALLY